MLPLRPVAGRRAGWCSRREPGEGCKDLRLLSALAPGPAAWDESPALCGARAGQHQAVGGWEVALSILRDRAAGTPGAKSEILLPNSFLQVSSHALSSSWKAVSDPSLL